MRQKAGTRQTGDIAEMAVMAAITRLGYGVAVPVGIEKYDFVATRHGVAYKVQVKSGRYNKRGYFEANLRPPCRADDYSGGDVDAFAVYNPERDEVYWLWFDEAPKRYAKRAEETWKQDEITEKLCLSQ